MEQFSSGLIMDCFENVSRNLDDTKIALGLFMHMGNQYGDFSNDEYDKLISMYNQLAEMELTLKKFSRK